MKRFIRAFFMCFGMFCSVPVPYRPWDEEARPLMTVCLPVVGAFIGALWVLCAWLMRLISAPVLVGAALLTLLPYLLTGFIHLDGFMDTCDAILSWRPLEERRRILKDPNAGPFAVISLACVMLFGFALFASMRPAADIRALLFIPIVSRACAGAAVSGLRPISQSKYAGDYHSSVKKSHILILCALGIGGIIAAVLICGTAGLSAAAAALGYTVSAFIGFRKLDGMSGDVSGFAQTIGELCAVAVFVLVP